MSGLEIFFASVNGVIILVTALIVWRYTRETYHLRKTTQEQTELLSEQMDLMREEFRLTLERFELDKVKHQLEVKKEVRALDPLLDFAGGNRNREGRTARMKFKNKGSTVKNLSVVSEGDFSIRVVPERVLIEGNDGYFDFSDLPRETQRGYFVLHYENLAGQQRSKRYEFIDGSFVEASEQDGI